MINELVCSVCFSLTLTPHPLGADRSVQQLVLKWYIISFKRHNFCFNFHSTFIALISYLLNIGKELSPPLFFQEHFDLQYYVRLFDLRLFWFCFLFFLVSGKGCLDIMRQTACLIQTQLFCKAMLHSFIARRRFGPQTLWRPLRKTLTSGLGFDDMSLALHPLPPRPREQEVQQRPINHLLEN